MDNEKFALGRARLAMRDRGLLQVSTVAQARNSAGDRLVNGVHERQVVWSSLPGSGASAG